MKALLARGCEATRLVDKKLHSGGRVAYLDRFLHPSLLGHTVIWLEYFPLPALWCFCDRSGGPSMKIGHELVTSGPYRFDRHPIYIGMLMALFGSGLVHGPIWMVVFILFALIFSWRIRI
jgi:protein-S-isoprenylcysteine O-methyltransferase Ste14